MALKQVISGMATYIPWIDKFRVNRTGGTDSARYCYSVWLRHLVMAKRNGLNPFPKTVAELGPGDSLGIGLAALISGSDKYFAFDVVEYANPERNVHIFDELVKLFENRENIPGEDEFPKVKPYLEAYDFPTDIFDEKRMLLALEKSRIERIRDSIIDYKSIGSPINYKVPWHGESILEKESVDMIFSQTVLQLIDNLRDTYKSMRLWLKPTGYISHQIDFKCNGTADEWNGHWTYSDFMWKLIRGKRPYFINRELHSVHIAILEEEGYRVVCDIKIKTESKYTAEDLAPRFHSISGDDITTSGAFIQAVKSN